MSDDVIEIGNEFTSVRIRKIRTRNGARLEIYSPRLGYRIHLDPLELESLTWQTTETFSRFLETPFGPREQLMRPLSEVLTLDRKED
ncbi:MAG: dihydrodiol dehydrogenase [Acidobacteria bacterium]|nr:MAG: dihydrodiol dehydrogenase [Acidobacteriota bacterium]